MNKPKSYLNKSINELEKYLVRLGQDEVWCSDKAKEFGKSAAGDHYAKAALEARKELERVKAELEHRQVLQ